MPIVSEPRKPIIPILKRETPILDKVRDKVGFSSEKIIETQDELVESFRLGLAEGLNLPLRVISEENTRLWFVSFIKSFVSPEHRGKVAPNVGEIRELGKLLGLITRESTNQFEAIQAQETYEPPNSPPKRRKTDGRGLGVIPL